MRIFYKFILSIFTIHLLLFAQDRDAFAADDTFKTAKDLIATDPKEALRELQAVIATDSGNPHAYYLIGDAFMALKEYTLAASHYQKAYKLQPKDKYEIAMGRALLSQNKAHDVVKILSEDGLTKQNTLQKLNILAVAYSQLKQYDYANILLKRVLSLDSQNLEGILQLARNLIMLRKIPEAQITIDRAVALYPDHEDIQLIKADMLMAAFKPSDAIEIYTKILTQDESHVLAREGRARAYIFLKDYRAARDDARYLMQNTPRNAMAQYVLAEIRLAEGDFKGANRLIDNHPNMIANLNDLPAAIFLHASVAFLRNDFVTAEDYLLNYLMIYPDNLPAKSMLALVKLRTGAARQALRSYRSLVRKHPSDLSLHYGLASTLLRAGEFDQASQKYQDILRIFGRNKNTAYAMAALKYACNLDVTSIACKNTYDHSISDHILEIIDYTFMGEIEKSDIALRTLRKNDPQNINIKMAEALILQEEGDVGGAYQRYLRILERLADHQDVIHALYRLSQEPEISYEIFKNFKKAYQLKPTPLLASKLALLAYKHGQSDYAQKILLESSLEHPSHLHLYLAAYQIGKADGVQLHFMQDQMEKIIYEEYDLWETPFKKIFLNLYLTHTETSKQDPEIIHRVGMLYKQDKQLTKAEDYFKTIIQRYPDYLPSRLALIDLYLSVENYKKAIETLKDIVAIDPTNLNYKYSLALSYAKSGDYETGKQYYYELLSQDENRIDVLKIENLHDALRAK